ncbi:cell wall-binding repeat-containing protein [Herbiconiux solani]|uniref:cell wall-binding repeat-containing protein n=1 Tax=Herbiconiux solani TaxID=661329 RepID=UPI000825B2EA|nr:cell wall-binding repeat-containing protein [Herbiconiux solani]
MAKTHRFRARAVLGLILGAVLVGGSLLPAASASAETLDQQDIRNATNDYRHMSGLPMLANNDSLNDVAQAWAEKMASVRVLSHNPDVGTQIPKGFAFWGENVASGYPAPVDMVDAWWFSPDHRANIMLKGATEMGSGYALDRNGVPYAVEIIASYPQPGTDPDPDPGTEVPAVPSAPREVKVTLTSATSIHLTWQAPELSPGSPVTSYEVTVTDSTRVKTYQTPQTQLDLANLALKDVYRVTVKAQNTTGWGASSTSVQISVPGLPTEDPGPNDPTDPDPTDPTNPTPWSPAVTRIAGADRYEASANISRAGHPQRASTVYIATGTNFPDALSAAAVAGDQDAPLLLTMPGTIPTATRTELDRLKPDRIIVLGGNLSVSDSVFDELNRIAPTTRVGGADRYDASRNFVAQSFTGRTSEVVYVSTGANFPDALSAAASAASVSAPVLLVPGTAPALPQETKQAIQRLGATRVVVVGGPNSVTGLIESELRSIGGVKTVTRVGGVDRFDASNNINQATFTTPVDTAYLATGYNFPDALSGAALAGSTSSPLFVVHSDCVPAPTLETLKSLKVKNVVLLGGKNSLTPQVEALTPCP